MKDRECIYCVWYKLKPGHYGVCLNYDGRYFERYRRKDQCCPDFQMGQGDELKGKDTIKVRREHENDAEA